LIALNAVQHIRQFKEDRDGNCYPMIKDGRARIINKNGVYHGIANNGEVIAASGDVEAVFDRLKHADKDVAITIVKGRQCFPSLDDYFNSYLPPIYRLSYSEAGGHGLIIALDVFEEGMPSDIKLYNDWGDVEALIKREQGDRRDFYIVGRQPYEGFKDELRDLNEADLPRELRKLDHLQEAVKERQRQKKEED